MTNDFSSCLQLYEAITDMQAWQVRDGANFVFFLPYSITQVIDFERSRPGGGMLRQYVDFICETIESALVVTAENFQVRQDDRPGNVDAAVRSISLPTWNHEGPHKDRIMGGNPTF